MLFFSNSSYFSFKAFNLHLYEITFIIYIKLWSNFAFARSSRNLQFTEWKWIKSNLKTSVLSFFHGKRVDERCRFSRTELKLSACRHNKRPRFDPAPFVKCVEARDARVCMSAALIIQLCNEPCARWLLVTRTSDTQLWIGFHRHNTNVTRAVNVNSTRTLQPLRRLKGEISINLYAFEVASYKRTNKIYT